MRVLVTGAGLIGCHFARRVVDAGNNKPVLYDSSPNRAYIQRIVGADRVELVTADIRDLPALRDALDRHEVDTLVHTAGLIGGKVAENPSAGTTNNIVGTINVLEAARRHGVRRFIYISTFGVYDRGRITQGPIREDCPIGGRKFYAVTKICSEQLMHAYASSYGLDTISLRPAGVFGRGHYLGGSKVGMSMRDLALNMIKGEPITIEAQRYFANEYVYVKDVALAIELACHAEDPAQRIYNVGSGVITRAADLAQAVRELSPEVRVDVVGVEMESGQKEFPLDLSRSQSELGYRPQFTLKEALRDYTGELKSERAD